METATANLEYEHIHILRLTDVMEVLTYSEAPDVQHLETIVALIRQFADGLHHTKEEKLLFPKLVEKGFSLNDGPIGVMMSEHVQGRELVSDMVAGIASYKTGSREAVGKIFIAMRGYVDLLRAHIAKENNVLFRMADKALSADEQKELLAQFIKAEQNPVCGGVIADCIRQIEALSDFYKK